MMVQNENWTNLQARRDREYRVCFMLTFVFFLAAAVIGRLLARGDDARQGGDVSVFAQAREMANTSITHSFLV